MNFEISGIIRTVAFIVMGIITNYFNLFPETRVRHVATRPRRMEGIRKSFHFPCTSVWRTRGEWVSLLMALYPTWIKSNYSFLDGWLESIPTSHWISTPVPLFVLMTLCSGVTSMIYQFGVSLKHIWTFRLFIHSFPCHNSHSNNGHSIIATWIMSTV